MSSWVSQDGKNLPDANEEFLPRLQFILDDYVEKDQLLYKQFCSKFDKSHSQLQEVFARFDKCAQKAEMNSQDITYLEQYVSRKNNIFQTQLFASQKFEEKKSGKQ